LKTTVLGDRSALECWGLATSSSRRSARFVRSSRAPRAAMWPIDGPWSPCLMTVPGARGFGGSANRRGDRRRDARRRQRAPRTPVARADRRALAGRAAHPRGAGSQRVRPRPAPRRAGCSCAAARAAAGARSALDDWAWEHLRPWIDARVELPVGPLFCVIDGRTRTAMVARRRTCRPAPRRRDHRRAPTLRAPSTAPRSRRRDGPRGRAAISQGIDNAGIIEAVHAPPRASASGQRLSGSEHDPGRSSRVAAVAVKQARTAESRQGASAQSVRDASHIRVARRAPASARLASR
jgi:hypothetical protein